MAWGSEASGYAEALERFTLGERQIAEIGSSDMLDQEKEARRREVLRHLGIETLRENETWLRAHRGRPLEPVVGG